MKNPWYFLLPAVVLITIFFMVPIINMARLSLSLADGLGFDNYTAFFSKPHQTDALLRSLQLAGISTLISSIIAWPLALFLAFCITPRYRLFCVLLLLAPFWTSFTIRAFSWQLVLSDNGVIASALTLLAGYQVTLNVLYTMKASVLGLALFGTMLTTLTLFGAMTAIERSLVEAGASLGAKPWSIFYDIILPLAAPGWVVGATLTFVICMGDYAVPTLLGGGLKPVLAQLMLSTVKGTYDLPTAATMAMLLVLLVLMAGVPFLVHKLLRESTG